MTNIPTTLRVDELLDTARAKSGLTEFGDDWFLEPLDVLVDSLNRQARLSEPGRALTGRKLVALLLDRLRLRALQAAHPEILEVPVVVTAEICGLPRTGSTLLQRLLASSPKLTSTVSWELTYPIPFPGEDPEASERKRRVQERMRAALELAPEFGAIHPAAWDAVDEDVMLVDRSFTSQSFESFYWVPDYGDWLRSADQTKAYDELRQWLQVLRWQDPTRKQRPWILKSPHHLTAVTTVLDTFRECKIVMTHRSPLSAVPSYASMVATLSAQYSDSAEREALGPYWGSRFATSLRGLDSARAERPDRFVDVRFDDLVERPAAEARRVLGELGFEVDSADDDAFDGHLARNRADGSGAHTYRTADFGLTPEQLERDFAFYTEAYL